MAHRIIYPTTRTLTDDQIKTAFSDALANGKIDSDNDWRGFQEHEIIEFMKLELAHVGIFTFTKD